MNTSRNTSTLSSTHSSNSTRASSRNSTYRQEALLKTLMSTIPLPHVDDQKYSTKPAEYYKTQSCTSHYLDQTLRLVRSPYELTHIDYDVPKPTCNEYFVNGVTHEEEGRYCYLKNRKLYGPQEKFFHPATTSQEIGWQKPEKVVLSPYARKPILREDSTRRTGVFTYVQKPY
eukprot:GDKJ01017750.1.p1 GENE.GDKJ01017750.1~~GDKJ01017750.1.p1  ORF type:complete len:183 (+),score=17.83 GDKJ01017750.1:32-550(+)